MHLYGEEQNTQKKKAVRERGRNIHLVGKWQGFVESVKECATFRDFSVILSPLALKLPPLECLVAAQLTAVRQELQGSCLVGDFKYGPIRQSISTVR